MEDELRHSGIDVIGDVPWGTHFCQFYKTKQDLIDILVPYFKAGLENNEFCMWVTSAPLVVAEAQEAMRQVVQDFDESQRKGQMEIIPYDEWYLLGGTFNDDRVLTGWVGKLEQALARGYSGLRLTGNTFWLERNHWQAFTEYEAKVNDVIGKYRMLAACTYNLDRCDGAAVIDVVRNHQFALIKQEGKWDIIESSIYKQAKEALSNALDELQQRNRETSALLEGSQAILMHKEFQSAARAIFDSCINLIGATAGYVALLSQDGTENEVVFLESGGRPCTVDPTLPMPIRGLRGEVYRTGKATYQNGFAESKWAKFMPAGHVSLDNVLFAPLVLEGKVIGLLGLANKPGGFTKNDAKMAAAFGRLAVIALLNSRTLESLEDSERILRQSEQDLNRAQAVAHTGSWRLDVRRNQLLWSEETYRIFGIPKGTPMTYETFLSSVHPEDREYVDRKWTAALRGEKYDIEHRIIVGNEVRWVCEKAELEFDSQGLLKSGFGTVQDITELKQAEEGLKKAAREWRATFDSIPDLISIHDVDFKLVGVNKAFANALNMKAEELIGKTCYEVVHCTNEPVSLCPHAETMKARRPTTTQFREPRLGIHLEVTTSPIFNEAGEVTGSVHVARDITERKKLEQLKDDFIGLVSHELRTPLTVINGCLSTVLTEWERLPSGEVRQLLQDAIMESESLSHLVENLLELSRFQAQQLVLYTEPTSIQTLVGETLAKIKRQAPSHRFYTSIPDELPLVNIDSLRIERILYNLLDNATKYSPPGSQIKVSAQAEPERLVISVSDQGRGLSPSEQARLFSPFQRLESGRPDRVRGSGLGLLVCRRLVEAHCGEVWVESKEGRGSTFFFSVPYGKSTDASKAGQGTTK